MNNYNKILEAVNRGIKFALDDFDDKEIQGQVNSKVKYQGGINEYIDLVNEVVDLGLPSGTLWCKYNLGVNSTQLSKPEDWYGDYYACGELKRNKSEFSWNKYKFGKQLDELTKYCNNPRYGLNGYDDNLTELLPEDDAAYQNKKLHNFKFHIPTKNQCEELINYTKNYWVNNYDPNKTIHNPKNDNGIQKLNGRIFEGKNGNQLFIPAAGYRASSNAESFSFHCYLWSSSLNVVPYQALPLKFNSNYIYIGNYGRCCGFSIRPVINL